MYNNCEIDKAIVSVAEGELSYMAPLYESLMKPIFVLVFSIVKNHAIAEDIMQDTFIKVQTKADTYKKGTNAKAWVFQIARNLSYNAIKKAPEDSLDDKLELSSAFDVFDNIEKSLDLSSALSVLDDNDRDIVVLHVLAGLKHKEIAEVMQIDAATIRKRYSRSINKLNKILSR